MSEVDFKDWLFAKYSVEAERDIEQLPEEPKYVMCVFLAHYLIGNGGFRYFFERDLSGNVSYDLVVESYRVVGLNDIAELIQKVLNIFPNSTPHEDLNERNRFLYTYFEEEYENGDENRNYSSVVGEAESLYYREFENIPEVLQEYFEGDCT